MTKNKPFVTFIVMAYKAEKFIQEAIDGAFEQTYDNMEIIFSDDASPDRTFEIIEENIKNYTGKHKQNIRAFKNEKNMGIGAHLNKLWWQEAKGDWIVVSAGDDVSLPNRVEMLMKYAAEDVGLIHHYSYLIDENSNILSHTDNYHTNQNVLENGTIEDVIRKNICVRGGTMCLNKKMLQIFGAFNKDIINEDIVLAYRAKYFGKIIHLNEKLMKYREHSNSISYNHNTNSFDNYIKMKSRDSRNATTVYKQILNDNRKLNLSQSFLQELKNNNRLNKIDSFLYGKEQFSFAFLFEKTFIKKCIKRLLIKKYLRLKNN
jgi:cellulose synthase/poly-beta-1,6-N-acetylglucosamine synthase-like glycosyltransferase